MKTSQKQVSKNGEGELMSSLEDFPANLFPMPEKSTKKNCNNCPHCIDRKDQIGWHFRGCFGGQYKGKPIAEIEECPLQQEQPGLNLEKELDQWRHKHFKGKRDGDYYSEYLERESELDMARHFYKLGLNARKEE